MGLIPGQGTKIPHGTGHRQKKKESEKTYVLDSLGYKSRSTIAESYGNSVFNVLRNCQTVFQSDCIILYFHTPVVYEGSSFSTFSSTLSFCLEPSS